MGNKIKEIESFFKAIRSRIYREKSATNDSQWENTATLFDSTRIYKYLSIIKDYSNNNNIMRYSFEKVRCELLARVNRLCNSNINSKKIFKAINDYAIFFNYHIGLQHLEPADFL
ncbi:hypothetical protein TCON_1761 [Astathelohania contejeani]|uniref:Uncharacterized protein n=1 Tax=Astathelohania contejeani TaxID=164912 RepID=A0ABQ7HXY8_9MICR|nr:hypothetical protein TCON_1761 [Thelohania contejeani]